MLQMRFLYIKNTLAYLTTPMYWVNNLLGLQSICVNESQLNCIFASDDTS